jgi:hypothetical protein
MQKLIKGYFSPLLFGLAFLTPLIAQSLTALGISTGTPALITGLAIGGGLGLMAQLRGSWLWVK